MGHRYYKAFYDAEKALIFVNSLYGVRFWVLLHEVGHHLLCLLPRTDFVYKLNQVWNPLGVSLLTFIIIVVEVVLRYPG